MSTVTQHIGTVESELTHQAQCSCGFTGLLREGYIEARTDLLAHYKEQPE